MGRKQEADGFRARIKSAGVQIKVLEQKGVIDIWSIQLWFGLLMGSFTLLYIFWSLFIVEDDPMAHFPAHMRAQVRARKIFLVHTKILKLFNFKNFHQVDEQRELFRQFGKRQGIAHQIHAGIVACDPEKSDAVIATVKNFVLLSISPVTGLILFNNFNHLLLHF